MRIGIDLGGTKIEALALDGSGEELLRYRVPTPRGDYPGTLAAIARLVHRLEGETAQSGTVGIGIPGSLRRDGTVKNANSTWLNGQPFAADLSVELAREVRVANDANCLAVSEATDGAAAGARVVFAVILGTGCGGGVAFEGRLHAGPNSIGGEWGHTPLPWPGLGETPGPACYCGRKGCLEMWVSGTGVARDFALTAGRTATGSDLAQLARSGDAAAKASIDRFLDRLARGLAVVIDILDPDTIVFGGGVSALPEIYTELPARIRPHVFGGDFNTPLRQAKFGDSSGVRGAAWLWPATPPTC